MREQPFSNDTATLDPADWSEIKDQGHRMLDDMFSYLETLRSRPVWKPMPEAVRQRFRRPLPRLASRPGCASSWRRFRFPQERHDRPQEVFDVFGLGLVTASGIGFLLLGEALGESLGFEFDTNPLDGGCRCPNSS